MCLILFAYQLNTTTPLILGANRDEYFTRPTLAADFWDDYPMVLAGRDQVAGGTWIGITKTGRFAALTNIREPQITQATMSNPLAKDTNIKIPEGMQTKNKTACTSNILKSRGDLTRAFLTGTQSCENYLNSIIEDPHNYKTTYAGFNLLIGEFNANEQSLFYLNNREDGFLQLRPGLYGLSNHRLNSPWPKVCRGKQALENLISTDNKSINQFYSDNNNDHSLLHQSVRNILENPVLADDQDLPATGLSYEDEKALSASFIKMPHYGTRTSTVITFQKQGLAFSEQNYSTDTFNKDNSEKDNLEQKRTKKEIDNSATPKKDNPKSFKIKLS